MHGERRFIQTAGADGATRLDFEGNRSAAVAPPQENIGMRVRRKFIRGPGTSEGPGKVLPSPRVRKAEFLDGSRVGGGQTARGSAKVHGSTSS